MKFINIFLAFIAISILSSCISSPEVVEIQKPTDRNLDCKQLEQEIILAWKYKDNAKADDEISFKYLFPPTAIASIINMNEAESSANKRIIYLENIYKSKGCYNR